MSEMIPVKRRGEVVAYALVDERDYDRFMARSWRLSHGGYAVRTIRRTERAEQGTTQMAREILGLALDDPREVDHVNRDRLDNRRSNLRAVSRAENSQNRQHAGGSSQHRGVTWNKQCQRWQAAVKLRGVNFYLGLFDDEEDAAEAARVFRAEHMELAA